MDKQLANMAAQIGLDPAFIQTPEGVQFLQTLASLAQRGLAPARPQAQPMLTGPEELRRTDPYGVM